MAYKIWRELGTHESIIFEMETINMKREIWKKIHFPPTISRRQKYSVSNYGNIKNRNVDKKGVPVKLTQENGYLYFAVRQKNKKQTTVSVQRMVALHFLTPESEEHRYIIHLDHDRSNNRADNLKWATHVEVYLHNLKHKAENASKQKKAKIEKAIEKINNDDPRIIDTSLGFEEWRPLVLDDKIDADVGQYEISNYGRIISYKQSTKGELKRVNRVNNYKAVSFRQKKGKNTARYVHKLVAETFIPNDDPKNKVTVIHLDHNKDNNHVSNLKWATRQEAARHRRKKMKNKAPNTKLTESDVIRLKKRLFDPKRKTRIKILAKQFGITEMQVWRIKSGENWGHIKV